MTRVMIAEIRGCMASSAAITRDVMATANQISKVARRTLPFDVTTVHYGLRRTSHKLRGIDLVIVPGSWLRDGFIGRTGCKTAKPRLPACRRDAVAY